MTDRADAQTAFIMVKEWDGTWRAVVELDKVFTVDRLASRTDIRTGTKEMTDFLAEDDLSNLIVSKLSESRKTDSERTAEAVRHALQERKAPVTTED